MSFRDAMRNRYTTKQYDPTKKIAPEQLEELKEILWLSPSSINSQPWKFSFVSDRETKEKLSVISWLNTQRILDCDTVVVFSRVSNIDLFEEQIEAGLPERSVAYYHEFIKPWTEEKIKAWFDRQVYLAVGILLAACAEMGIDSTPMEGIEPENYDAVLGQTDYATVVAVAIGYRDPQDTNQPASKPKSRRDLREVVEVI